ncbi:Acetyltransferase domain protein [Aphelenchoides besseyi]|nr:Acetyltransferase domain protein [Aphelenchoides besseyi]
MFTFDAQAELSFISDQKTTSLMSDLKFEIKLEIPGVDEYTELRSVAGLSPFKKEAAAIGLPNSWVAVCVRSADGQLIGMGRIIGDGGQFFQVVDIAVRPSHQKRGIGKQIMTTLCNELDTRAPKSAFVSLLADGEAHRLYRQFGFEFSAPYSLGMQRIIK